MEPVRVVLAGAHGHGWWHLDNLRRLSEAGLVELAGVCDVRPVDDLPAGVEFTGDGDLDGLIQRVRAEVTILCTPIHTHADLAERALRAGSHLLLEKPPAATYAGYERIAAAVRETGLACQVGFQSLGSAAIPAIRKMVADGVIGQVTGVGAAGAWERPYSYYGRVPWAGRREIDGVPVVDGVLTNPLAHATATALAVSGAEVADVRVELYRANDIEADDTSCARVRLNDGTTVTVAVSLCADRRHEPYLIVHGTTGRIRLTYTEDRVEFAGTSTVYPRTDLLENLVAHVRRGAELLVPLERTAGFMRVLEAVRLAPAPRRIPDLFQEIGDERRVLPRIAEVTAASAQRLALYSELRVPWTRDLPGVADTGGAGGMGGAGGAGGARSPRPVLLAHGRPVAEYVVAPEVPRTSSPRPYLHPVRTLGGTVVTEVAPADHVHHLGAGIAISDLGGSNFWGGRTYVRDRGPAWLGDHGTQRHLGFSWRDDSGFGASLAWEGPDGTEIAREERTVRAVELNGCWALDVSFTLTNLTGRPLPVRSSATKGRAGAGYGGFFWRAPGSAPERRVLTRDAEGEDAVHGSTAPWLAMTSPEWTLLFLQPPAPGGGGPRPEADGVAAFSGGGIDPWFVRVTDYPGVGPALAWETPLLVGDTLTRRVVTVVVDGPLDRAGAAALAAEVPW
ncbi:putative dehydrogenase [Streptosporangium becharense]|uniref:Putative dehydrogenase n=1 Tax=Streptosporangium becharense TaxID=1816182 RepID=A0A7W9MGA5_9ACTN|nr:DUF6807 family protein [Streptosporangium becharense]MBB2909806.1 putative dehydrogenase [Streptosporangium becharense]MBB5819239.1 putative dehydrogenase [Streptosporangium becharense]